MYDFEYCMKHKCEGCKKQRECDVNDHKKKNKNHGKRTKQTRKKHCNM